LRNIGFLLEPFKEFVEIATVEDEGRALTDGPQKRSPTPVKGAALDSDVAQRLGVRKTSLHVPA
jgi:hypothetical protein